MESSQYDAISDSYAQLVKTDPQKQYVQYPSALELLGDVSGKKILDVGCGSGNFDKILVGQGAHVVGYDNSAGQIDQARKTSTGGEFVVAGPEDFSSLHKFDKAVSVLVLHYAQDAQQLEKFFSSTASTLKTKGEFVCILVNPGFKRIGQTVCNRRFSKLENGEMRVDFIGLDQQVSCYAQYRDFSFEDYEHAALNGGFSRVEWKPLRVAQAGIDALGAGYWQDFEEDCLYIGFIAYK